MRHCCSSTQVTVCVCVLHSCMHANHSLTNCRLPSNSMNCLSLAAWDVKNYFRFKNQKPPSHPLALFGRIMENAIVWGLWFLWLWRLLYWDVASWSVVFKYGRFGRAVRIYPVGPKLRKYLCRWRWLEVIKISVWNK